MEAGGEEAERRALKGLEWLAPLQVLDVKGDWAVQRPHVRPGGWAFQYNNAHYPDTDDTAVVAMAMDRARTRLGAGAQYDEAIDRAVEWTWGMQSRNGGWGAFDADNDHYYLNNIPFADHGALLDPPTVDVSARCVGMMAQLGVSNDDPRMKAALDYLEKDQEADGSWFGRWGVNYVYGTWSALCALNAAGLGPDRPSVRKAADWLVAIQNPDGGWGESCDSYALDYKGYEPAASRALADRLGAARPDGGGPGRPRCRGAGRRAGWRRTRARTGSGTRRTTPAAGFPRVFYLRYHGYSKFFPLWALARYRNVKRANDGQIPYGM